MADDLTQSVARAMCAFEGLDPDQRVLVGVDYRARWFTREFYGRARASIDEIERLRATTNDAPVERLVDDLAFRLFEASRLPGTDPDDVTAAWAEERDNPMWPRMAHAALSSPSGEPVVAIPAGMKPWHGGASTPADYGGRYALRNGTIHNWTAGNGFGPDWTHTQSDSDIIAYTPKPTPTDTADRREVGAADVAFLRDLAGRLFKSATPAMGFDQGDTDQLYRIAASLISSPPTVDEELAKALDPWWRVWTISFEPFDGRHSDDDGAAPLMPTVWPTIGDLRRLAAVARSICAASPNPGEGA